MTSFSRKYPAADVKVLTAARSVIAQVCPLLAFTGVLLGVALFWMTRTGDWGPVLLVWSQLAKPAVLGLAVPFALHESAHVFALKRIPTVTHIVIERTTWRTSVVPSGTMSARHTVLVALIGPGACVAVGTLLWASGLGRALAWWYLAHVLFLLPFFGDGRALWNSLPEALRKS
ncbi:hypothetical protein [Streptomyces parvus]|uniref:DUF3267 domain-containing protein n=1 Tax=Streptomyces parvus TaxID=66428 RepID=A0A7K3RSR7_9ACTN|nr:hypothetical protein [Streptomyces parvus]NEC18286.1 hypothetical protein [Streptomyces parvus]